ncbi:hypothetical protein NW759_016934 [Fusarium solani]|nr:hypothetical protein NW759_016934 [Fusarium solani]
MSVGFGFSVGDFIAGLELVATIIDALRETGDSSRRHRELIRELYSLEAALLQVKRLELHESLNAEKIALHSAASQCQRTIMDFWQTIQEYGPSLGRSAGSPTLKDQWMKVKWALFKEEEVEKFKADLRGHTGSINLLLKSCHLQAAAIEDAKRKAEQKSLMSLIQNSANECMNSLSQITTGITSFCGQGNELLQMTATVLRTNIQIFHAVLDLQAWIRQIPGQVQHQQPVLFLDALGRRQQFHLDFIQSADALRAVLRDNFKRAGVGVRKIDRGEFVLYDRFRHADIDLSQAWERCFRPGQTVEMSMIFSSWDQESSCPTCGQISDKNADEEVECSNCGMTFRRIAEVERSQAPEAYELPPNSVFPAQRDLTEDDGCDDVALFRRVRVSVITTDGIFGRVIDTVNTARDIAHVIWNVGWRK